MNTCGQLTHLRLVIMMENWCHIPFTLHQYELAHTMLHSERPIMPMDQKKSRCALY
jgi:hypothetical protein